MRKNRKTCPNEVDDVVAGKALVFPRGAAERKECRSPGVEEVAKENLRAVHDLSFFGQGERRWKKKSR